MIVDVNMEAAVACKSMFGGPESTLEPRCQLIKVAKLSLLGFESFPFIWMLFKTSCRYNTQIWQGQNIFTRLYIHLIKRNIFIVAMATWMS